MLIMKILDISHAFCQTKDKKYFQSQDPIIDETIKVSRQFLKDHPEEIKTKEPIKHSPVHAGYINSPEAFQIAELLNSELANSEQVTASKQCELLQIARSVFQSRHIQVPPCVTSVAFSMPNRPETSFL